MEIKIEDGLNSSYNSPNHMMQHFPVFYWGICAFAIPCVFLSILRNAHD